MNKCYYKNEWFGKQECNNECYYEMNVLVS